jgi:hypothetical protein
LSRLPQTVSLTGSIPRNGFSHQQVCIPGYGGHIAGKVAENMHGATFRAENERAAQHVLPLRQMRRVLSEPGSAMALSGELGSTGNGHRGLSVAPRVPGYAGNIPGKLSETVHGMRFAEANEASQSMRHSNPFSSTESWMRRGNFPVDKLHSHQWCNRFQKTNTSPLLTAEEERDAFENSRRLGSMFGLKTQERSYYRPGDRYLHALTKRKAHAQLPGDPNSPDYPAAGQPSHSLKLEPERVKLHQTSR